MAKIAPSPQAESAAPLARVLERRWFAPALIGLLLLAAYYHSFALPFVFDDLGSIVDNPSIRQLGHSWNVLTPPDDYSRTVGGRPVVNLSFALNYAFGGTDVRGYHVVNLALHGLAALTLFGLVRRTLLWPKLRKRFGDDAAVLALSVAALWAVHPLQTEAVTYIVQRAESLAGLFYLLTLYAFVRGIEAAHPGRWQALAFAACLAGMATKEIMASAPLVALLYDRTLVTESFHRAWRMRGRWYVALFSTWLLLGFLVLETRSHGGSAGFGAGGIGTWPYLLTQSQAIIDYFKLAAWPQPLVFDYGTGLVQHISEVAPQIFLLVLLIAATLLGLRRRAPWSLAGAWVFLILAPSSSIVPVATQTIAEHRMYLPLAALLLLAILGLHTVLRTRSWLVFAAFAVVYVGLTIRRNQDYASVRSLWADTVAKRPENARAQHNLGAALADAGLLEESIPHEEAALRLDPSYYEAHYDLGLAFAQKGKTSAAIAEYTEAARLKPTYADAQLELGRALLASGRPADAQKHLEIALQVKPQSSAARNGLGYAFTLLGQPDEAIAQFTQAVKSDPNDADAHYNLGNTLFGLRRFSEAVLSYREALRVRPNDPETHYNLANTFVQLGQIEEAKTELREALRIRPDYTEARDNLSRLESPSR